MFYLRCCAINEITFIFVGPSRLFCSKNPHLIIIIFLFHCWRAFWLHYVRYGIQHPTNRYSTCHVGNIRIKTCVCFDRRSDRCYEVVGYVLHDERGFYSSQVSSSYILNDHQPRRIKKHNQRSQWHDSALGINRSRFAVNKYLMVPITITSPNDFNHNERSISSILS